VPFSGCVRERGILPNVFSLNRFASEGRTGFLASLWTTTGFRRAKSRGGLSPAEKPEVLLRVAAENYFRRANARLSDEAGETSLS